MKFKRLMDVVLLLSAVTVGSPTANRYPRVKSDDAHANIHLNKFLG